MNSKFPKVGVALVRSRAIDPGITKIARTLVKWNYDVTLIEWDRHGDIKDNGDSAFRRCLFSLRAPYDKPESVLLWPLWWLYEIIILLKLRSKIIHFSDLDTMLPAIICGKIIGSKLAYSSFDFYADNLPEDVPNLLRRMTSRIEVYGMNLCDVVFVADESRISQIGPDIKADIEIIYNSPDEIIEEITVLRNPKLPKTVFYAGILLESRGLKFLIETMEGLENVELIIAGIGPIKDYVEEKSRVNSHISYIGHIDHEDVITQTLKSDILVAMYDPSIRNNRYASPNKLFEAMMCGKPIIVNSQTRAGEIVKEVDCGMVVKYGDVRDLKEALVTLSSNMALYQMKGENGKRAYNNRYNWILMEARIGNAYQKIINN
jgi:glycosyltransferase involved in cell wall biosynthesis